MKSRTDFYQLVQRAGAQAVDGVKREQAIRIYCEQHRETWNLQVRGPRRIRNGWTAGADFMVATAKLNRADLVALRDAVDALLRESDVDIAAESAAALASAKEAR